MPLRNNKHSGLALITVLFVFALISLLAVGIQQKMSMNVAQTEATILQTQARIILLSAEDIAKAGLIFDGNRDVNANEEWDTASELWNMPLGTQMTDAKVGIYIRDLQGLFNVNSLHPSHSKSAESLARFKRLLGNLGLNTDLADNIKEWLTQGSSANYVYQNYEPPYSAAEIEFSHPSELRLIEDMDSDSFIKLEPYISTLPMSTPLNINTMPAMVLWSWDVTLTQSDSEAVTITTRAGSCGPMKRGNFVFKAVTDFWSNTQIAPLVNATTNPNGKWDQGDFTVKSKYFSVIVTVEPKQGGMFILESLIKRDYDKGSEFTGVISRDFSRHLEDISRLNSIVTCSS